MPSQIEIEPPALQNAETKLSYEIQTHNSSTEDIKIIVENSDGKKAEANLTITISEETNKVESSGFLISCMGIILIGIIAFFNRRRRSKQLP